MIINPLKTNEKHVENDKNNKQLDINNTNIEEKVIEYILDKQANLLKNNREIVENLIKEKIINDYSNIGIDISKTVKLVLDRFFGYYILQKYIDNEDITDIRAINYKTIFIKKKGVWNLTGESFNNPKEYLNFVRNCILKNGGKINNEIPINVVSDKEKNLRIEAGIDPINVISPNLIIRIHRKEKNENLESLLFDDSYMFDSKIYLFLLKAVLSGCNIIISGKGGSGKTTLLRSLINKIPDNIAITSNEETAEIFSNHPNIIQREIIQNRLEDKNITLEKLTKQCLVMSNDAIVVGELKGAESMAFLDAISTGHIGYATIHSNNSENTINRLSVLMKKDRNAMMYTNEYLERIISQSLDLIIYMDKFKIMEITEIDYDNKIQRVVFNKLYRFRQREFLNGEYFGFFEKISEPKYSVLEKFNVNKYEIERILNL